MLVIAGRIVPLADDPRVAPDDRAAFRGKVWIGDDGLVTAVTRGRAAAPPGFDGAPVVDVGRHLVLPGLLDLHNHLAYATLPVWAEPRRAVPWLHRGLWPSAPSYAAEVTWPAYALATAAPAELLAFAETTAIVGGTTSIQGSPPKNRPRDGWLVRNVEDETFGVTGGASLVFASVLTLPSTTLGRRANQMRDGSSLIYHCAEGMPGSLARRDFTDAANAGCLQERFIAIHASAIEPGDVARWSPRPGSVVWSPLSNLWLYGTTTPVPEMLAAGVRVCLGSDWAPSGTKHVLGELKVARLVSDAQGWGLSDHDLVKMVTTNPGDALGLSWPHRAGRLQPGALGDVVVVRAGRGVDPFTHLVNATETDVELVVVGGRPRYGTAAVMDAALGAAGAGRTSAVDVAGTSRALALDHPTTGEPWAWDDVVARLEEVRADPRREVDQARGRLAVWAGRLDQQGAPLRIALDMPTGVGPLGGLPKDLSKIVVPPLASLVHDEPWLAALTGRGFHDGLLDGLRRWYG